MSKSNVVKFRKRKRDRTKTMATVIVIALVISMIVPCFALFV